ncbi:MAG: hypothetical protein KZQ99_19910 [Candidatus Thiodiazotropha sp. (ex Dulcina madagascariensis)]|nr:hypothetical protein [Candidatus Thiodiazotropha sp. (ex Dulcina madagascariensis)]
MARQSDYLSPKTHSGLFLLRRVTSTTALFFFLTTVSYASTAWIHWRVEDGGNDHYYKAVTVSGPGISWEEANIRASRLTPNSHLATITSQEENNFLFRLIDAPEFWPLGRDGPLIGGSQAIGASAPDSDWTWVTGEPFTFTAWHPIQPDDLADRIEDGEENFLHYWVDSASGEFRRPTWNDTSSSHLSYIVEATAIPIPPAIGLFASALLGLIYYGKRHHRTAKRKRGPSIIRSFV